MESGEIGNVMILLVEDDDLVRSYVERQLGSLGYRVVSVTNGPAALEEVRRAPNAFDLVFTDLVMPGGMGGMQLAEEVTRLNPRLPVLFTSGYAAGEGMGSGRLEDGILLLQKPYRRQDLAAKVIQAIGRGGS